MIELGNRGLAPLDRRTRVGKAVHAWKDELLQDLGGIENISTQQLSIVDLATRTKVLLDSVDAWLLRQDGVINRRKRSLYPIVRERQQLADSMAKYMQMLGLERRQRPTESLESYVARKYGQKTEAELEP